MPIPLTVILDMGSRRAPEWSAVRLYVSLRDYNWWGARRCGGVIHWVSGASGMDVRDLGIALKDCLKARRRRGEDVNDANSEIVNVGRGSWRWS